MTRSIFSRWLMGLCLLAGASAQAADIDLFAGVQPTGAEAPYVLLVVDNGASFSASNSAMRCSITAPASGEVAGIVKTDGTGTAATNLDGKNAGVEQCALYSVIASLSTSTTTVNIGVMFMNATGFSTFDASTNTFSKVCPGNIGGCLGMPIVPINATTQPRILEWIRQWTSSGNTAYNIKGPSSLASGGTMQEAWAYYNGKTGVSGRDYSGIAPAAGCASKHVIFVGNNYGTQASPKDDTGASGPLQPLNGTSAVTAKRASPAATAAQIASIQDTITTSCGTSTLDTAENKGAYALNWARYMKANGITTYSVGILGPSCDSQYGAHLTKLGSTEVGGGKFFSTNDYSTLVAAFQTIIGEIQSVNSVFAAVSLPVANQAQGNYLNQVYVGMFRPHRNFLPRWNGNLKQYKMGMLGGSLKLLDSDDTSAINSLTGFVTECARSYWTPNTADTYWALDPSGGCLTVTGADNSNYPDGNIVEKGGQGHKLRGMTPASRTVKTCSPVFADCTTLTDFSTGNAAISQALLNSGGSDRTSLINWARGTNTADELDKGTSAMRPSVHGDIVHSRPVAINHGTDGTPSVVVYYGGNDGMLRAVNGNRGSAADATVGRITSGGNTFDAGAEMWAFMPPEFYASIKRIYENTTTIAYPGTQVDSATPKDYGIDGTITAFQGTIGGAAKSYIYAGMRRGGRVVYAFDVTTPGSPALLWKKGCPNLANDTGCSDGYAGMGQTWSSLKTLYATGYGGGGSPLLIMGGGYDTCEDYDSGTVGGANHNCTSASKGKKVYVVDAVTGAVVKAFDTDRSVIADATIVKEASGAAKYAYTADMGGNVYRVNFGSGNVASWSITKIASLGCDTTSSCTANRKFMFQPSVVTADGETFNILLGSGDREKPVKEFIAAKNVTNYFFMLKDKPSDATSTVDVANCGTGTTVICKASLLGITTTTTPTDAALATVKGWYLGLAPTEQVVTTAITIFGVTNFSTHQPAVAGVSACTTDLGTTLLYQLNYKNAGSANGTASRFEDVAGDGLPPSPVAGQVTLDDGTTVPFCIGCSKDSPLESKMPGGMGGVVQPKGRLYWYIQK